MCPAEQRTEAHVVVDVLVVVDVPHVGGVGSLHHDGMRVIGLEAGGHSERQDLSGALVRAARAGGSLGVESDLAGGDLLGPIAEATSCAD
jgi:hypothetical protein